MDKIIESIGSNLLFIVMIVCFTIYQIYALKKGPSQAQKYEELRTLNELREKGVITQEEFNEKKAELLSE